MFDIPTVPTAQELLDKAFRRSVRARAGKPAGKRADKTMILTASNILIDNLRMVVRRFPNFDQMDVFYRETIDIVIGLDKLKVSLGSVGWAASKIYQLSRAAIGRLDRVQNSALTRRHVYGRISSIMQEIAPDLDFLVEARNIINALPHVTSEPTILIAGYPNVGKSSFVSRVTNAKPQIASYPFTTKGIIVGHIERRNKRYQIVDLPGLLDRPLNKRNLIELQAIAALKHLGDAVLFIFDPTRSWGYDLTEQQHLLNELRSEIMLPFVVAINKADVAPSSAATEWRRMSIKSGEGVDEVLNCLLAKAAEHKSETDGLIKGGQ